MALALHVGAPLSVHLAPLNKNVSWNNDHLNLISHLLLPSRGRAFNNSSWYLTTLAQKSEGFTISFHPSQQGRDYRMTKNSVSQTFIIYCNYMGKSYFVYFGNSNHPFRKSTFLSERNGNDTNPLKTKKNPKTIKIIQKIYFYLKIYIFFLFCSNDK